MGEKLVKMLGFCQNWVFGQNLTFRIAKIAYNIICHFQIFKIPQKLPKKVWVKNSWKCWGFVKIKFWDKNLTFRIAWTRNRLLPHCVENRIYTEWAPNDKWHKIKIVTSLQLKTKKYEGLITKSWTSRRE